MPVLTDFWHDLQRPPAAPTTPRAVVLLALLLALVFGTFNQLGVPLRATRSAWVSGDEPFYLLTTVSLLADGDLDLRNDYALRRYRAFFDHPEELWHQSVPTADGRLLAPHNVGTAVLLLPAYALGGAAGAKRLLGALGGLLIAATFLLAYRATGHVGGALAAAAFLGTSAPLFVYATQVYPEAPAALLVVTSAWLALRNRPGWRVGLALAFLLSALLWLGIKYALIAAALGVVGLARLTVAGRLAAAAFFLPSAGGYVWFHVLTYGDLTPYAVNRLYAGSGTAELIGLHLEVWNRLYRFAGLWVDGEFGLVRWAPALLLVLPALPLLANRPGPSRWLVGLTCGAQLLVAVFLSITMRGWWFPGRMLIVALPLLAIPLAVALSAHRGRPWLALAGTVLGIYGLGITLALRAAVAAQAVVLAVDPFALPWTPFQAFAGLFPVYTTYDARTWLLTAGWVLVAAGLVTVGCWLSTTSPPVSRRCGEGESPSPPAPSPLRRGEHVRQTGAPSSHNGKGAGGVRSPPHRGRARRRRAARSSWRHTVSQTVIVGGGPAGLAAAYRLTQRPDQRVVLLERAPVLGGLAAGFRHDAYTLDFGPHRLHPAADPEVLADLRYLLGAELETRPRRGLIRLGGRYLPYPVGPATVAALGWRTAFTIGCGVLAAHLARRRAAPRSYEEAIQARLGRPLYQLFYGPYAAKVWGCAGSQIAASQAERRVNQRGLADLVRLALGQGGYRTYLYPRGGFGRIPAAYAEALRHTPTAAIRCAATVEQIAWQERQIRAVRYHCATGAHDTPLHHLVWAAPLPELVRLLDPPPPAEVRAAAGRLRYRAVVLCYVVLAVSRVGWADTYYFPEPTFPFNRVMEQKNFSSALVPADRTVLCLDIACDPDDARYCATDADLHALVVPALQEAGLIRSDQVLEVFSRRFRHVYPVYDLDYERTLQRVQAWLATFDNLWLIGRQGLFLHDNTHHALRMGYAAADAIAAGDRRGWPAALAAFATVRVAD